MLYNKSQEEWVSFAGKPEEKKSTVGCIINMAARDIRSAFRTRTEAIHLLCTIFLQGVYHWQPGT
jgi:hypothetical protein